MSYSSRQEHQRVQVRFRRTQGGWFIRRRGQQDVNAVLRQVPAVRDCGQ